MKNERKKDAEKKIKEINTMGSQHCGEQENSP